MSRGQLSSAQRGSACTLDPVQAPPHSVDSPLTRLQPVLLCALDLREATALLAGEADGQRKPLRARQRLR